MISKTYFQKVNEKYNNGYWINNPTLNQADLAIKAGSIGCTTNPTYAAKMIKSDTDGKRTFHLLKEAMSESSDINEVARILQRKTIIPLLEKFMPIYKSSGGKQGFVSIQGDPLAEDDADMIIKEALEDIKLGKNVIAKIPTTSAGIIAIKYLAKKGIPIIATEIMSLSQVVSVCEAHKSATKSLTDVPPLYVTHITGIFDEYLQSKAIELGVTIPDEVMSEAGLMVARKQYRLMAERGYSGIILGGGAREIKHFTGLVGGNADITINWKSTSEELLELNLPIEDKLNTPINEEYVKILKDSLPDYILAYEPDALPQSKFESYGPVVLFRNAFIKGWKDILKIIEKQ